MRRSARLDPGRLGVETAALALAAAAVAFVAAWLPDAEALDALLCLRFYLAQGCMP